MPIIPETIRQHLSRRTDLSRSDRRPAKRELLDFVSCLVVPEKQEAISTGREEPVLAATVEAHCVDGEEDGFTALFDFVRFEGHDVGLG